jgi:hypothetical protein
MFRNVTEMSMPLYRIQYILKVSTERFKHTQIDSEKDMISSIGSRDEIAQSFDGKNKQFANQLIYESIALFTTGRKRKNSQIVEYIPDALLAEDRRRRLYGTPS